VDHTDGGYAYITDNSARDPGRSCAKLTIPHFKLTLAGV
jgi:hypothetical protein